MSAEQFLNRQILELRDQRAALMKQLDERNEATKVWIQSDTQTRAYANKLERALERIAKKDPNKVGRNEAADMAVEFNLIAREAIHAHEAKVEE